MPLTRFHLDLPDVVLPEAGGHLTGERNSILAAAFGAQMDACAEQVLAGRLQAIPFCGGANAAREGAARAADGRLLECEPFVLPILAAQRGIRLWPTEPILSQRVRVARSQQIRAGFGTDLGKLQNVQPYFLGASGGGTLPWIRLFHQSNEATPTSTCHTLDPSGAYAVHTSSPSIWNWDGQAAKSSRFWVAFHLPLGFSDAFNWNAGPTWNGGKVWGGIAKAVVSDLVGMLLEAKGAGSRLAGVFLTTLQPTDSIPGYPGRHPFDPTDTAIQDAAGWTSLPVGNWGRRTYKTGPYQGHNTRPPFAHLVYLDNP